MIICNWSCWRIDQVFMKQQSRLLSLCLLGEVRLPVDVMFGGSEIRKTQDEYVDDVRRNMENAYTKYESERKQFKNDRKTFTTSECQGNPLRRTIGYGYTNHVLGRPSQGNSINNGLVHTESSKEYQIRCIVFS